MKNLILILAVLVVLSGCQYTPQTIFNQIGNEEQTSGYVMQEIVLPKEGSKLQSGSSLSPVIRLTNSGYFETNGQVCISGLESQAFRGFSGCECNVFSMKKEEKTFIPEEVNFGPYTILSEEPNDYTLTSITRYKYKSIANVKLCIKENAYDMASCGSELVSTKDGPLEIVSVEQESTPLSEDSAEISLSIDIAKQAEGDVWDFNAVQEMCRPQREIRRNVRVKINNLPFSANSNCGEIPVDTDETNIKCNLGEIRLKGASFGKEYYPEIEIEMDYAFETRNSNKFSVE